ncbi:MAG: helix-turn-helix domain-containing protein [Deltaproteobacteria bacterium]|nr:MAG: helix-turn-helix domain-containing protein [Deltaproteobacteria bacterium]
MKRLGANLRAERLARGISLEQISADTRVSMSMLRAIEDGNTGQLPAPVLVKGFLRAYAKTIGLDPEALVVQYQELTEEVDARLDAIEKFHRRLRPKSSSKKGLVLLLGLALLLGLTLLLWPSKRLQQGSQSPAIGEQTTTTETNQETTQKESLSETSQDQPLEVAQQNLDLPKTLNGQESAGVDLTAEPPSISPSEAEVSSMRQDSIPPAAQYKQQTKTLSPGYVLRAETFETTWLLITVDNGNEREYLLQPGEQLTWQAMSGYKLLIGNAAGIQLYLNGKPLKSLGESGRVVRLELPDPSLTATINSEQTEPVNRP